MTEEEIPPKESIPYDYTYVSAVARIALYDDLRSAPHITEIPPAETSAYIENLSSKVYELARNAGGRIPYTVIREVSENFIHARFKEIIVSILDNGQTIRFADQGPGIGHKEKAQLPGFSSAIEPMKKYIRGVGSGLPIVKEYLEFSHGTISIEDNMGTGSVVTISMDSNTQANPMEERCETAEAFPQTSRPLGESNAPQRPSAQLAHTQNEQAAYGFTGTVTQQAQTYQMQPQRQAAAQQHPYVSYPGEQLAYGTTYPATPFGAPAYDYAAHEARRMQMAIAPLSQRERDFLVILLNEGALGVTKIAEFTGIPTSSTYAVLKKLEESGLVEKMASSKRILTPWGKEVAQML